MIMLSLAERLSSVSISGWVPATVISTARFPLRHLVQIALQTLKRSPCTQFRPLSTKNITNINLTARQQHLLGST